MRELTKITSFDELIKKATSQTRQPKIQPPKWWRPIQTFTYTCQHAGSKTCERHRKLPIVSSWNEMIDSLKSDLMIFLIMCMCITIMAFVIKFFVIDDLFMDIFAKNYIRSLFRLRRTISNITWIGVWMTCPTLIGLVFYASSLEKAQEKWDAHADERTDKTTVNSQSQTVIAYLTDELDAMRAKTIESESFKKTQNELVERLKRARALFEELCRESRNTHEELKPALQIGIDRTSVLIKKLETADKQLGEFVAKTESFFTASKNRIAGLNKHFVAHELLKRVAQEEQASNDALLLAEKAVTQTVFDLQRDVLALESSVQTIALKGASLSLGTVDSPELIEAFTATVDEAMRPLPAPPDMVHLQS